MHDEDTSFPFIFHNKSGILKITKYPFYLFCSTLTHKYFSLYVRINIPALKTPLFFIEFAFSLNKFRIIVWYKQWNI